MSDHVIKAAREAGITFEEDSHGRGEQPLNAERPNLDELARFYAIAFAAGMERAAESCKVRHDHEGNAVVQGQPQIDGIRHEHR